jgi:hypothetical protein
VQHGVAVARKIPEPQPPPARERHGLPRRVHGG